MACSPGRATEPTARLASNPCSPGAVPQAPASAGASPAVNSGGQLALGSAQSYKTTPGRCFLLLGFVGGFKRKFFNWHRVFFLEMLGRSREAKVSSPQQKGGAGLPSTAWPGEEELTLK